MTIIEKGVQKSRNTIFCEAYEILLCTPLQKEEFNQNELLAFEQIANQSGKIQAGQKYMRIKYKDGSLKTFKGDPTLINFLERKNIKFL